MTLRRGTWIRLLVAFVMTAALVAVWACHARAPNAPTEPVGGEIGEPEEPDDQTSVVPPGPSVEGALGELVDPSLALIMTPSADGHQPFIRAIDAAQQSIDMTMFHLTDEAVVTALVRAARRGVKVRVIVDGKGLKPKANKRAFTELGDGGVAVRPSSPAFSITHEKGMVVDGNVAFITAINLTRDADKTRDFGVITHEPEVVTDVEALFAADWSNAETKGHTTPALHATSLVVSPTTSRAKLIALIRSATHNIHLTVESLGDKGIEAALGEAASHGVFVLVLVPACDKIPNALYNLAAAQKLSTLGVSVRMMAGPESAALPYIHSKMILVDRKVAYVGSINFSGNSINNARELGVIFENPAAVKTIYDTFQADFGVASDVPKGTPADCTDITGPAQQPVQ